MHSNYAKIALIVVGKRILQLIPSDITLNNKCITLSNQREQSIGCNFIKAPFRQPQRSSQALDCLSACIYIAHIYNLLCCTIFFNILNFIGSVNQKSASNYHKLYQYVSNNMFHNKIQPSHGKRHTSHGKRHTSHGKKYYNLRRLSLWAYDF